MSFEIQITIQIITKIHYVLNTHFEININLAPHII